VLIPAGLSAACAINFNAERITLKPGQDNGPGIVYALPKTELSFALPFTITKSSGGELADIRLWRAKCDAKEVGPYAIAKATVEVKAEPVRIASEQVIDYDNVYRVRAEQTNPLMTVEHTFDNSKLGVVAKASSSGQNNTGDVLVDVAKTIALQKVASQKLAASSVLNSATALNAAAPMSVPLEGDAEATVESKRALGAALGERSKVLGEIVKRANAVMSKANTAKDDLCRVAGRPAVLAKLLDAKLSSQLEKLTCEQVTCITDALDVAEDAVSIARTAAREHLYGMSGKNSPAGYPATFAAEAQREVERLEASFAQLESALHITGSSQTSTVEFAFKGVVPGEAMAFPVADLDQGFVARAPGAACDLVIPMGPNTVPEGSPLATVERLLPGSSPWCGVRLKSMLPIAGSAGAQGVETALEGMKGDIWLLRVVPPAIDGTKGASRSKSEVCGSGCGYRYRIAADGVVDAVRFKPKVVEESCDPKQGFANCLPHQAVRGRIAIAQYGPIASLPATFTGKDAKVKLTFTDTGAMESIQLGQSARDGAAVSGAIKELGEAALSAREKRQSEAQKAADAARTAELDAVKASNELLEAQIKNDRLKQCIRDRTALPPASNEIPSSCKE
jgi:hypothetical protein